MIDIDSAIILRLSNSLERHLLRWRVNALVLRWKKDRKRLMIYGGGFHTKKLLHETRLSEAHIVGVSDTDVNKHGQRCGGYLVIPPEAILKTAPDVVLISSKDCEDEIYDQLRFLEERQGVERVRIYAGSPISRLFKVHDSMLQSYEGLWLSIRSFHKRLRSVLGTSSGNGNSAGKQRVLVWDVPFPRFDTSRDLVGWLRSRGVQVTEGGHTIYIPPQGVLASLIPSIAEFYPPNAGFKVLKDFRGPEETSYFVPDVNGRGHSKGAGRRVAHQITANLMCALGLGPRAWDVCAWRGGGGLYTVFVVDHVPGTPASEGECRAFVSSMKALLTRSHLRITMPGWEQRDDFRCPDCNGNMIRSDVLGMPQYVDFQYFDSDADAWTNQIIHEADDAFHFGDSWLAHKPLYQSVPGSSTVGKRNSEKRLAALMELLQQAGLNLHGRLVLDVGCNAGMMLYCSLVAGAAWTVGWDRQAIVPFTRDLLFSLGATRVHLFGADLDPTYPLEEDIPVNLRPMVREAVVFYLSVRDHIGLSHSLKRIPWRVLIYEGHQGESTEEARVALQPLLTEETRVASSSYLNVKDGDAYPRPIVLLVRGK